MQSNRAVVRQPGSSRRRPGARCALALAAVALLAGGPGAVVRARPPAEPLRVMGAVTTPAPAPTPAQLSLQIETLADATASQWAGHELPNGGLNDPVLGPLVGDYGVSMTGQALVQAGLASDDEKLIDDGLRSLVSEVRHPDSGGFELLGLSEAYAFDQLELARNPAWSTAGLRIARYLRQRGESRSDLTICYTNPHCYTNLKLVSAVADLALLRTGLHGSRRAALLADPGALRHDALRFIRKAVHNTGADAYRLGPVSFADAGIISDPTENPLAYHALSTMMLGKAVLMLDAQAPSSVELAFERAAQALVGLMAPDGDDTYIGRGQAQVWTLAATIDALAIAAELTTTDPIWRGRYLSATALALARLEELYPSSGWGFPLVPRLAGYPDPTSYQGIDNYANTVEYNGLALWALQNAAQAVANAQPAAPQALPASGDGAFVDPSHTRFAAVTHDGLWYAIHATDSNLGDARYGFGLMAAEIDTIDGWQPALPERPLSSARSPGGVEMMIGKNLLYPAGRHLSVTAAGQVLVKGGWSDDGSGLLYRGTLWSFQPEPSGDGVTLSFYTQRGAAYAFEVWYEAGARVLRSTHGLSVEEPDGTTQTYSLSASVRFSRGVSGGSGYSSELQGVVMTTEPMPAASAITYTTLLSAPSTSPVALGPSGSSGASGASGPASASGLPGAGVGGPQ